MPQYRFNAESKTHFPLTTSLLYSDCKKRGRLDNWKFYSALAVFQCLPFFFSAFFFFLRQLLTNMYWFINKHTEGKLVLKKQLHWLFFNATLRVSVHLEPFSGTLKASWWFHLFYFYFLEWSSRLNNYYCMFKRTSECFYIYFHRPHTTFPLQPLHLCAQLPVV